MGTWPCGTVVVVGQLFGAESKAQVYGNIHTFLQDNSDVTTQLGIYICTPLNKEMELFRYKNLYVKFMYVEL